MNGGVTERQTDGRKEGRTERTYCAGVKDLASAYVLCPRLTEQCVFLFGRVGITERAYERVTEVEDGRSAERRNKYGKME